MTDVLKNLKANLEGDPVAIMSKARVEETIAEIERLQSELAAERDAAIARAFAAETNLKSVAKHSKQIEAERDAMRGLLQEALPFVSDRIGVPTLDLQIRIKNALKGIK